VSDWLVALWAFGVMGLPWLLAVAAWRYADNYHKKALEWKERAEKSEARVTYMMLKQQGFDLQRFGEVMREFGVSMKQAQAAWAKDAAEEASDE
jgi:hypothetical protein